MAEIKIKTTDGNNAVTLAGPASGADVTLKLPTAAGSAGQYLKTDGSNGQLSFSTVSAGTTLTGSTNNTVCTVTGADAIAGEADLTFDGTILKVGSDSGSNHEAFLTLNNGGATGQEAGIIWEYEDETNPRAKIHVNSSDQILRFSTANAERFKIDSTGRADFFTGDDAIAVGIGGSTRMKLTHTGGGDVTWSNPSSGTATYSQSSDYRLKQDVVTLPNAWSTVKALKPYEYKWKHNTSKTSQGFFAHEVIETVPNSQAAFGTKDAVDSDDNPIYQQIDHSKLVPLLTKALQEAITEIETLKTKVAALEAGS